MAFLVTAVFTFFCSLFVIFCNLVLEGGSNCLVTLVALYHSGYLIPLVLGACLVCFVSVFYWSLEWDVFYEAVCVFLSLLEIIFLFLWTCFSSELISSFCSFIYLVWLLYNYRSLFFCFVFWGLDLVTGVVLLITSLSGVVDTRLLMFSGSLLRSAPSVYIGGCSIIGDFAMCPGRNFYLGRGPHLLPLVVESAQGILCPCYLEVFFSRGVFTYLFTVPSLGLSVSLGAAQGRGGGSIWNGCHTEYFRVETPGLNNGLPGKLNPAPFFSLLLKSWALDPGHLL